MYIISQLYVSNVFLFVNRYMNHKTFGLNYTRNQLIILFYQILSVVCNQKIIIPNQKIKF